ncbi:hypothetical protein GJ496_001751 [Pomphorhynchus laevis]|nr:hypothetical protein GJ496_001751 [Pomphorhynchus laevis]
MLIGKEEYLGKSIYRLFNLMETSSTKELRYKAAEQISEVAKLNACKLDEILSELSDCLMSTSADIRSAASYCFDKILSAGLQECILPIQGSDSLGYIFGNALHRCIQLSSSTQKTNMCIENLNVNKFKDNASFFLGTGKLDCDPITTSNKTPSSTFPFEMTDEIQAFLSNDLHLKRINTEDSRSDNCSNFEHKTSLELQKEIFGRSEFALCAYYVEKGSYSFVEQKILHLNNTTSEMRFNILFEIRSFLYENLFHKNWERRHGALLGLRAFWKSALTSFRASKIFKDLDGRTDYQVIMEDLMVRLIALLVIDRFADYGSDELHAPVRQVCSELIGICACELNESFALPSILKVIEKLAEDENWEIKHSALMSFENILPKCKNAMDNVDDYIPKLLMPAFNHSDMDVTSVACRCFFNILEDFLDYLGPNIPEFIKKLQKRLHTLDNVFTCSSLVVLMSKLIVYFNIPELKIKILRDLFRCITSSNAEMREASVSCIESIILSFRRSDPILPKFFSAVMRALYSRIGVETHMRILDKLCESWKIIINFSTNIKMLVAMVDESSQFFLAPIFCPSKSSIIQQQYIEGDYLPAFTRYGRALEGDDDLQSNPRIIDFYNTRHRINAARSFVHCICHIASASTLTGSGCIHSNQECYDPEYWIQKILLSTNLESGNHRIGLAILLIELMTLLHKMKIKYEPSDYLIAIIKSMQCRSTIYQEQAVRVAHLQKIAREFIVHVNDETDEVLSPELDSNNTLQIKHLCDAYNALNRNNMLTSNFKRLDNLRDCLLDINECVKTEQDVFNISDWAGRSLGNQNNITQNNGINIS